MDYLGRIAELQRLVVATNVQFTAAASTGANGQVSTGGSPGRSAARRASPRPSRPGCSRRPAWSARARPRWRRDVVDGELLRRNVDLTRRNVDPQQQLSAEARRGHSRNHISPVPYDAGRCQPPSDRSTPCCAYLTAASPTVRPWWSRSRGCPPACPYSPTTCRELARRRLGYGRGPRMRFEQDELELLGGIRHGRTLGSPIAIVIRNSEWATGKWSGRRWSGRGGGFRGPCARQRTP